MFKLGTYRLDVDARRALGWLTLLGLLSCGDGDLAPVRNNAMDEGLYAIGVRWFGRVDVNAVGGPRFAWSGTGFTARFHGTSLAVRLANQTDAPILFRTVVDGVVGPVFSSGRAQARYPLGGTLADGEHTVELYRQTEGGQGSSQIIGFEGSLIAPPPPHALSIEVIGDSVSAGYGALGKVGDTDCYPTESHWDAWPAVLARKLNAELTTIAASGVGLTRNYGGDSAKTMRELYPRTLTNEEAAWAPISSPHAVIINLGANDINDDKGDPGAAFEQRYVDLLVELRQRYPDALILCTIGPTLTGTVKDTMHARIRASVEASADPDVHWFGEIKPQADDKYGCAYHPNPSEHELIAEQLSAELKRLGVK